MQRRRRWRRQRQIRRRLKRCSPLLCARLPPGAPLRASLCAAVADEEGVSAAWVTTCVGSLRGARLRLAGAAQVLPRKPRRQSERGLRITCTYVPYGRRAHASPA